MRKKNWRTFSWSSEVKKLVQIMKSRMLTHIYSASFCCTGKKQSDIPDHILLWKIIYSEKWQLGVISDSPKSFSPSIDFMKINPLQSNKLWHIPLGISRRFLPISQNFFQQKIYINSTWYFSQNFASFSCLHLFSQTACLIRPPEKKLSSKLLATKHSHFKVSELLSIFTELFILLLSSI